MLSVALIAVGPFVVAVLIARIVVAIDRARS